MLNNIPHLKDITPDHIDAISHSVFKSRFSRFLIQSVLSVLTLGTIGCVVLNQRRFYLPDGTCKYVRVKNILDNEDRRLRRIGKERFMIVSMVLMVRHIFATIFPVLFYGWFIRKWFKFLYSSDQSGYKELGRILYNRIEKVQHLSIFTRRWFSSLNRIKSRIDIEEEFRAVTKGLVPIIVVDHTERQALYQFLIHLAEEDFVDSKNCTSIFRDSFITTPIVWEKSQKSFVYTFQLLLATGKIKFSENIWKCLSKHFVFIVDGKVKSCSNRTLSSVCSQLKINKLKKLDDYKEHLHSLKSPENRKILKIYIESFDVNTN